METDDGETLSPSTLSYAARPFVKSGDWDTLFAGLVLAEGGNWAAVVQAAWSEGGTFDEDTFHAGSRT